MDIVTYNPYRYLGVYSNSPTKERVANQGKMKAFLKVGKTVDFPVDFPALLEPITRTVESINEANSKLTLPADQIKYAQFWWMKATPLDYMALKYLSQGNTATAESIWSKAANASSLQNRIVLALVKKDYPSALSSAETLYGSHAASFAESVTGSATAADAPGMIHTFLDELLASGLDAGALTGYITNGNWRSYISEKSIQPLIDGIAEAIENAKATKGKGSAARLEAGRKLINSTKEMLNRLKGLIPQGDIRYETTADKLGLEILNCSIDYYNDSPDDDSPYKAQELLKYAQAVVVGQFAKDRCKKNAETMEGIIAELPPREVMAESRAIMNELRLHSKRTATITNAITLLNNTKNVLQTIKNKLGANHEFYLKISTTVVNAALGYVIEEVNSSQKNVEILGSFYVDALKATLKEAWSATLLMDTFDMESGFKNGRYTENRSTLRSICQQVGVSTYNLSSVSITHKSDNSSTSRTSKKTARKTTLKDNAKLPGSKTQVSKTESERGNIGCTVILIIVIIIFVIGGGLIGYHFDKSVGGFIGGMVVGFIIMMGIVGGCTGT